ncbi:MAG: hypothetical protein R6V72_14760 [Cyclobacterium sp.]|uniref:hypothetical protein n=1 Tax=Cyclobacterium sp. TaxID=1966343 RepID=UPI003970D9BD
MKKIKQQKKDLKIKIDQHPAEYDLRNHSPNLYIKGKIINECQRTIYIEKFQLDIIDESGKSLYKLRNKSIPKEKTTKPDDLPIDDMIAFYWEKSYLEVLKSSKNSIRLTVIDMDHTPFYSDRIVPKLRFSR